MRPHTFFKGFWLASSYLELQKKEDYQKKKFLFFFNVLDPEWFFRPREWLSYSWSFLYRRLWDFCGRDFKRSRFSELQCFFLLYSIWFTSEPWFLLKLTRAHRFGPHAKRSGLSLQTDPGLNQTCHLRLLGFRRCVWQVSVIGAGEQEVRIGCWNPNRKWNSKGKKPSASMKEKTQKETPLLMKKTGKWCLFFVPDMTGWNENVHVCVSGCFHLHTRRLQCASSEPVPPARFFYGVKCHHLYS